MVASQFSDCTYHATAGHHGLEGLTQQKTTRPTNSQYETILS